MTPMTKTDENLLCYTLDRFWGAGYDVQICVGPCTKFDTHRSRNRSMLTAYVLLLSETVARSLISCDQPCLLR